MELAMKEKLIQFSKRIFASMMAATAVDKMLILNSAQNVNANSRRHVLLDIIAL